MRESATRCAWCVAAALAQAALLAAPAALTGGIDERIAAFLALSILAALAERAGTLRGPAVARGSAADRGLAAEWGLVHFSADQVPPAQSTPSEKWTCPLRHRANDARTDSLYTALAAASGLGLLAMSWIGIAQRAAFGPDFPSCPDFPGIPGIPGLTLHWAWAASLALGGIILRGWSAATLGPTFDAPPSPQQPRTNQGPYAWLAHPSEIGLLTFAIGAACLLESAWAIAACALLVAPPSLARAAVEDQLRHRTAPAHHHSVTPRSLTP